MGAFIGRWAGACARGSCMCPVAAPALPTNSGPHHHHGGPLGSRFQVFGVTEVQPDAMVLTHTFRTEDDGVPGTVRLTLHLQVTPRQRAAHGLMAEVADAATVFNPTGHAFSTWRAGSTLGHTLQVPASRYVPLAPDVPPRHRRFGAGHAVRLSQPRSVADATAMPHEQLARAGGWTTTWCWTMPPQSL